jgi:hypothetical protein
LIRPQEFSGIPSSSLLVAKQEDIAKEMVNSTLRSVYVRTLKVSLTCHQILRHGVDGFSSPPKEGVMQIVIALENP